MKMRSDRYGPPGLSAGKSLKSLVT